MRTASSITAQPTALSVAPGARVPRVEVRAEHHQLVALLRAGQLGDDVVRLLVAIRDGDGVVEPHPRRDVPGDEARHAVVVLGRHGDHGRGQGA
jgi:hypothetical protein